MPPANSKLPDRLILGLVLALALVLRVTAFRWGLPQDTVYQSHHPDEAAGISTMLSLIERPLRGATDLAETKGTGYFYAGAAAILAARGLGLIHPPTDKGGYDLDSWRRMHLATRAITVLFSLATALLVYAAGRLLFSPRAALGAALIEAISPVSVLNAHYVKEDCAEAALIMLVLYFAARSARNRRWLAPAALAAGAAAGVKYPGASALIIAMAAAWSLDPENRKQRIKTMIAAIPLLAVGFFLVCPAALAAPDRFAAGLAGEFGRKLTASEVNPLLRIIVYPWFMAKAAGIPLIAATVLAGAYSLRFPKPATSIILAWFIPYALLVASAREPLVRYAVPLMPGAALLIAAAADDILKRITGPRARATAQAGLALAALSIILATGLHLAAMLRPDPRCLARDFLEQNVPANTVVAITPSIKNDGFFVVPVDPKKYRVVPLSFRPDDDAGPYWRAPFTVIAANRQAYEPGPGAHPSQAEFWNEIRDSGRWRLLARFENRPAAGIFFLRGALPGDLYYIYQDVEIYARAPGPDG